MATHLMYLSGPPLSGARQLLRWLLVWALLWPVLAHAGDYITERAWLEDPSGQWSLDEALTHPFTPYEGLLSRGYGTSAIWIRLRIDPHANPPSTLTDRLVLRLRLTYLDQIQLFDPQAPAATQPNTAPVPFNDRTLNLNYLLPKGDVPRDIYLRLQSPGTRTKMIEVLNLEEALDRDRQQETIYGLYLSGLLVSLLWALLHWFSLRERVIGVFACKQAVALLWSLSLLGYVREPLGDAAPTLVALLLVVFTATSAYFDYSLFREYQPPRWTLRVLLGLMAVLPVAALLILSGHISTALRLNIVCTLLIVLWNLVVSLLARPRVNHPAPAIPQWGLVSFHGVLCLSIVITALMVLGVLSSVLLALHSLQIHGLVTGLIMVIFLQVRSQRLTQRQTQALADLAVAQKNARQEQLHRQQQEKLLEEIRQLAFHDSLTHLPNRRLLLECVQLAVAQNQRYGHHSALLFMDLDNFKPLNDAYGHHVGDLLLIEVAQRLRQSVRACDTVSRFGGDEFVILLNDFSTEATTAQPQAQAVAEKILTSLRQPYRLQTDHSDTARTVEHHCSASIGIRLFTTPPEPIESLLDQADAAMYAAKAAGRSTIRFYTNADALA